MRSASPYLKGRRKRPAEGRALEKNRLFLDEPVNSMLLLFRINDKPGSRFS